MTTTTQSGNEQTTNQPVPLGPLLPQASTTISEPKQMFVALCLSREPEPPIHLPDKYRHNAPGGIPDAMRHGIADVANARKPWPLFMWGPCGTGKSCAALRLLDHCGGLTHYWTVQGLCEHLIACDKGQIDTGGVHPVTVSRRAYWQELKDSQIVVLDELGTRRKEISDHHLETVKRVLDIREGKPLIVISNLRVRDLAEFYGDRIPSRCAAGTILDWSPYPDRRIAHHKET